MINSVGLLWPPSDDPEIAGPQVWFAPQASTQCRPAKSGPTGPLFEPREAAKTIKTSPFLLIWLPSTGIKSLLFAHFNVQWMNILSSPLFLDGWTSIFAARNPTLGCFTPSFSCQINLLNYRVDHFPDSLLRSSNHQRRPSIHDCVLWNFAPNKYRLQSHSG